MSKTLKRILSAALALCMTACVFTSVAYADGADLSADEAFLAQKQLLESLGILKFNIPDADSALTRPQLVDMAVRTYIEDLESVESAATFNDVIPNYEFKDAIEAAYSSGIVKGNGNGEFGVTELATTESAVVIMLRVLGLEHYIGWQGDFNTNYLTVASKIGLTNNVDLSQDNISFKNAVQLVYNAIGISPQECESVGLGEITYYRDKDETLISRRLNIFELDGTVTDNRYTSVLGGGGLDGDFVKIDGSLYRTGDTKAADFIGYSVHIYYRDYEDGSIPTVLHIEDNKSHVTEITDRTYAGFSDGRLSYYSSSGRGAKRSVNIGTDALIIYNGVLLKGGQYSPSLFDITNGSITVIEKSVDNLTVVNIKSYNDVVAERVVDAGDYLLLVDKFDPADNIKIEDEELFDVRDASGAGLSLTDIAPGSTVSAAVSIDGRYGSFIVSGNSFAQGYVISAGTDSAVVKSFNNTLHTYEEIEYTFSDKFKRKNEAENIVSPGYEYTVYINAFGDVAYMDLEKDISDFYAYIVGVKSESRAFDDDLTLKVFRSDGKFGEYTLADNVKIDGESCKDKSGSEIRALLGIDSDKKSKLVYMSLTYDSEIRSIDTCPEFTDEREADYSLYKTDREAEDTIYKINPGNVTSGNSSSLPSYYSMYSSTSKAFNTGLYMDSNTKIMAIPKDSDIESRFKILSTASVTNGGWYDVEGYSRDDDAVAADVVVFKYFSRYSNDPADGEVSGSRVYAAVPFARSTYVDTAFVNAIAKGTDANTGDDIYILSLLNLRTGTVTKYNISDASLVEGLSKGDIVRWYTMGGDMCYLEKVYNVKDREFFGEDKYHGRTLAWNGNSTLIASYWMWPNYDDEGEKCEYITDSWTQRDAGYFNNRHPASVYMMAHAVIMKTAPANLSFVTYDNYIKGNTTPSDWYSVNSSSAKVYRYNSRDNTLDQVDINSVVSNEKDGADFSDVVVVVKSSMCQAIIIY